MEFLDFPISYKFKGRGIITVDSTLMVSFVGTMVNVVIGINVNSWIKKMLIVESHERERVAVGVEINTFFWQMSR